MSFEYIKNIDIDSDSFLKRGNFIRGRNNDRFLYERGLLEDILSFETNRINPLFPDGWVFESGGGITVPRITYHTGDSAFGRSCVRFEFLARDPIASWQQITLNRFIPTSYFSNKRVRTFTKATSRFFRTEFNMIFYNRWEEEKKIIRFGIATYIRTDIWNFFSQLVSIEREPERRTFRLMKLRYRVYRLSAIAGFVFLDGLRVREEIR